jgi:hypothetical protein
MKVRFLKEGGGRNEWSIWLDGRHAVCLDELGHDLYEAGQDEDNVAWADAIVAAIHDHIHDATTGAIHRAVDGERVLRERNSSGLELDDGYYRTHGSKMARCSA